MLTLVTAEVRRPVCMCFSLSLSDFRHCKSVIAVNSSSVLYYIIFSAGLKFVSVINFRVLDVYKICRPRCLNLWSFNCACARHVAATFCYRLQWSVIARVSRTGSV